MHIGIISPPVRGHINPFAALGREMQRRGHRVTWIHMEDLDSHIRAEGLDFYPVGQRDHPRGSLPESLAQLGRLQGLATLRFTVNLIRQTTEMLCRDLPNAIRAARIDALLVDQAEPAGGSVADYLGIPFVTVCNALALNRDPYVPPPFTPWKFRRTSWARIRNSAGYAISDGILSPVLNVLNRYRKAWRLRVLKTPEDACSKLAQISQQPPALDFPRQSLPANFHYVGPLRDTSPRQFDFPWEKLDGRPLIYASLGTLQNGKVRIFRCFAEACAGIPVQLVIAHGGGLDSATVNGFPGNPLVVNYAPQTAVIERCALTLTHAGLNTVLDSMTYGVPVIAVPITYEQPAIAARLEFATAGEVIPLRNLTSAVLKARINHILNSGACRKGAAQVAASIREAGGVRQAASLAECAFL
jgi:MGT family glycosyltransferase